MHRDLAAGVRSGGPTCGLAPSWSGPQGAVGWAPFRLPWRQHPTLPSGGSWVSVARVSDRLAVQGDAPRMMTTLLDSNEESRCYNAPPDHVRQLWSALAW